MTGPGRQPQACVCGAEEARGGREHRQIDDAGQHLPGKSRPLGLDQGAARIEQKQRRPDDQDPEIERLKRLAAIEQPHQRRIKGIGRNAHEIDPLSGPEFQPQQSRQVVTEENEQRAHRPHREAEHLQLRNALSQDRQSRQRRGTRGAG